MNEDVKDVLNDMAIAFEMMAERLRDPLVSIEDLAFVQKASDRLSDNLSRLQNFLVIDAI